MAGGASSRMKKSLQESSLDSTVKEIALNQHKSLIPLGNSGKPMLYYLLRNASGAGIKKVYIITSEENSTFHQFLNSIENDESLMQLQIHIAIQYLEKGREKPLGTADALKQCLEQYENLTRERFTVCNGDNLYSSEAMKVLRQERKSPHATIAYIGSGLGFDDDQLAKFAVMEIDNNGFLQQIIEKPSQEVMNMYRSKRGELSISMNIFNFSGNEIYPFLVNCPINPKRKEKELPEAVRNLVRHITKSVVCFYRSERIPDLTTAKDISLFQEGNKKRP